jgi:hypothetical protein
MILFLCYNLISGGHIMDVMETRLFERIKDCVDKSVKRDTLHEEVEEYQNIIGKLKKGQIVPGYSKDDISFYRMKLTKLLQQSRDAEAELKDTKRIYNNILSESNINVITVVRGLVSNRITEIEDKILEAQTNIYSKDSLRASFNGDDPVYLALVDSAISDSKKAVAELVKERTYYNIHLLYLSEAIGTVAPKAFEKKLKGGTTWEK